MFTEDMLEQMTIESLQKLGYRYQNGASIDRDYSEVLLKDEIIDSLARINPNLDSDTIYEAYRMIKNLGLNNVIRNNQLFSKYLHTGISIASYKEKQVKYHNVKLIDYDNIDNNSFLVVNQYTIIEYSEKRPDIIIFINGMPLVVMELKSTVREDVTLEQAYRQLKGYQNIHIPSLFYYNQILVISDGVSARAGTITSPYTRFNEWKKTSISDDVENRATHDTLIRGMFSKDVLLDIIDNYILYSEQNKILSAYHQYYGVKKAINKTLTTKNGKAGILWHTQGSGKSFSMIFYVGNMIQKLSNPTIIVVTDRNDLDNQLFETFTKCSDYLRQNPKQIENRRNLIEVLEDRKTGGIIFTTLQKFVEKTGLLSNRDDILVLVDEAHRSHYGLEAIMKIDNDSLEAYQKYGTAKYLHNAFPNATYLGFTGTPIETRDRSTSSIFGEVIDIYDMTQSIDDGATVPILYESRLARVGLNNRILDQIDDYYELLEQEDNNDIEKIKQSKKMMAKMKTIIEDPKRLEMIVKDIITHYEDRKSLVANKAMVVAYSRQSAYFMYQQFLKLRPDYQNSIRMIITPSNQDSVDMQEAIGTKQDKRNLEHEFKDPNSKFKIAIVVDMWLTGFDVPSLGTMYIDKPMKSHNLMQAIARVNRVYQHKSGGLIVDYIGLKKWLMESLKTYTKRDQSKIIENKELLRVLFDKIEIIRTLFHGFDYHEFATMSNRDKYNLICNGADHILKTEDMKRRFLHHSYDLKNLYSLCTGSLSSVVKDEILYIISVRSFISKLNDGKVDAREINQNVAKMLEDAIQEDELIHIGVLNKSNKLSLLTDDVLVKLSQMKSKNIAAEILNKAMKDYINNLGETNVVLMEKFSTKFKKIADSYNERNSIGDIQNVLEELIKLKQTIDNEVNQTNEYNLSSFEKAIFDVLSYDESVEKEMSIQTLVEMSKELVKTIENGMTIDWDIKKASLASMRLEIKKVLIRYNYPVKNREKAVLTMVKQAELKSKNKEFVE